MSEQTQEAADMREDVLKASTAWDQGTGLLASAQLSTCADARAETTSAMQAIRVVARCVILIVSIFCVDRRL